MFKQILNQTHILRGLSQKTREGIPWWSSGSDSALSLLRAWFWSLVGKLKSHKPQTWSIIIIIIKKTREWPVLERRGAHVPREKGAALYSSLHWDRTAWNCWDSTRKIIPIGCFQWVSRESPVKPTHLAPKEKAVIWKATPSSCSPSYRQYYASRTAWIASPPLSIFIFYFFTPLL